MTSGSRYTPAQFGRLRTAYRDAFLRRAYEPYRRQIRDFVNQQDRDVLRILECGHGPGFLLRLLEQWFPSARLFGLDIESELIHHAASQTRYARLVLASAQQLPFESHSFDVIVALHMVEHLPQPHAFFAEARRAVQPGGLLIIATPNPAGIGARVMASRWVGLTDPGHISLHPPGFWRGMIRNAGFEILREGTTALSGIPAFRLLPLSLFNWGILAICGTLPWDHGEAYTCAARAT